MGKLQNIWERVRRQSAAGVSRFRSAAVLAVVFFLLVMGRVTVMSSSGNISMEELFPENILYMMTALVTTLLFAVLWRIGLERKDKVKNVYELVNIPVLAGSYFLWQMMPMTSYFVMYLGGVIFCLPCLSVYVLWTKEAKGLFPHIFGSFWKASGIGLLTFLLGSICLLSVDNLLLHVFWGWWYVLFSFSSVLSLLLFLSYLPQTGEEKRSPMLFFLLQRIFMPVYIAILGILYIYIGKIIVAGTMPVGKMNWYASFAVAVYCLFYFCLHEEDNKRSRLFLRFGALALFPVMIVQAWGIYIRFDAYGLTTARYASMVCNFFGFLTVLSALCRNSARFLFLLAGFLGILCSLTPLNIIDVPAKDQWTRLDKVLSAYDMRKGNEIIMAEQMTKEDKENLRSAYWYLAYDPGRWKYPVVEMMKKDKDLRSLLNIYREDSHIDLFNRWETIPVDGYKDVYIFDVTADETEGEEVVRIITVDGQKEIPLAPYRRQIEGKTEETGNDKSLLIYNINENRKIYFENIRIPKEKNDGEYYLHGYLLEK